MIMPFPVRASGTVVLVSNRHKILLDPADLIFNKGWWEIS